MRIATINIESHYSIGANASVANFVAMSTKRDATGATEMEFFDAMIRKVSFVLASDTSAEDLADAVSDIARDHNVAIDVTFFDSEDIQSSYSRSFWNNGESQSEMKLELAQVA